MRKLIGLLIISLLVIFTMRSNALTIEEMDAWVGPENVTEYDVLFADLMVKGTIQGPQRVLYGRGYLEILDVLLDQPIPDEFQVLRWGKVDPEPVILSEFLLLPAFDLPGDTCLITLCSKDWAGSMKLPQPAWRLGAWSEAVIPFGYSALDFLTYEKAEALKPLPEGF